VCYKYMHVLPAGFLPCLAEANITGTRGEQVHGERSTIRMCEELMHFLFCFLFSGHVVVV
jgi:hypothetical protein